MPNPTLFHYEKCGTCKKARKFLETRGIEVALRPIVEQPPTVDELRDVWKRSGAPLKRFFNTSGQSYRALPERDRLESMDDEEKLRLLAADGKLIRRPILDDGRSALVGFDEKAWAAWADAR